MGKISGKYAQFLVGGREYEFIDGEHSMEYDEADTTDSSTPDQGTDSILGWASAALKINAFLTTALGSELTTGTCVAGTRYLVTGGSIVETQGTFALGRIFESDGTGPLSGTNKVKALGAKIHGKNIACTIGGSDFPVTSLKYSEQYGEFDSTDSDVSGDVKEFMAGRAKRTATMEAIVRSEAADKLTTSPVAQALILTFGTSDAITGNAIIKKKNIPVVVAGDFVKITYEVNWQGTPVSTLENLLPAATSTAAKFILFPGASTNKEYTGNILVMSTEISSDMNSPAKISYGIKWSGAVTEAVAN